VLQENQTDEPPVRKIERKKVAFVAVNDYERGELASGSGRPSIGDIMDVVSDAWVKDFRSALTRRRFETLTIASSR
jgi:hypothetical protein